MHFSKANRAVRLLQASLRSKDRKRCHKHSCRGKVCLSGRICNDCINYISELNVLILLISQNWFLYARQETGVWTRWALAASTDVVLSDPPYNIRCVETSRFPTSPCVLLIWRPCRSFTVRFYGVECTPKSLPAFSSLGCGTEYVVGMNGGRMGTSQSGPDSECEERRRHKYLKGNWFHLTTLVQLLLTVALQQTTLYSILMSSK